MAKIKTAKICIDVGDNTVKIIKTDSGGVITHAGSASVKHFSNKCGGEYESALTLAIKAAALDAGIHGKGSCAIVTGDPYIIIHRFNWPKMPTEALALNARSEITPYLPGNASEFTVSYKIIGEDKGKEDAETYNVMVATMLTNSCESILDAVRKAGFNPKSLSLRETARQKITATPLFMNSLNAKSFAVLDICDSIFNMTIFINGKYYANRYFSSNSYTKSSGNDAFGETGGLIGEVSSTLDYIHYKERGTNIKDLLIFGDTGSHAALINDLANEINVRIHTLKDMQPELVLPDMQTTVNAELYADAYIASVVDPSDIDLIPKKETDAKKERKMPVLLPCLIIIACALIASLIFFPAQVLKNLTQEEDMLIRRYKTYTVTEEDVAVLTAELNNLNEQLKTVNDFILSADKFSAQKILKEIDAKLISGTTVEELQIKGREIIITGYAHSTKNVADYRDALSDIELFKSVSVKTSDTTVEITRFTLSIMLKSLEEMTNENE